VRIDKYLHATHLVGKREAVRELAGAGRLFLNGVPVKASREVRADDSIRVSFWNREVTVLVRDIPRGSVPRRDTQRYFEVLDDRRTGGGDNCPEA
jgi:ribosome-associated heat shock protein Hsp15